MPNNLPKLSVENKLPKMETNINLRKSIWPDFNLYQNII